MLLGTKNSKQTQEIEQQVPKRGVPFGKVAWGVSEKTMMGWRVGRGAFNNRFLTRAHKAESLVV